MHVFIPDNEVFNNFNHPVTTKVNARELLASISWSSATTTKSDNSTDELSLIATMYRNFKDNYRRLYVYNVSLRSMLKDCLYDLSFEYLFHNQDIYCYELLTNGYKENYNVIDEIKKELATDSTNYFKVRNLLIMNQLKLINLDKLTSLIKKQFN